MIKVGNNLAPRKRRKKVSDFDNEPNIFLSVSRDNLTVIAYILSWNYVSRKVEIERNYFQIFSGSRAMWRGWLGKRKGYSVNII